MIQKILDYLNKLNSVNNHMKILIWNMEIVGVFYNEIIYSNSIELAFKQEDARILEIYYDGNDNYMLQIFPSLLETKYSGINNPLDLVYLNPKLNVLFETVLRLFCQKNLTNERVGDRFILIKKKNKYEIRERINYELLTEFSNKKQAEKYLVCCNNNFGI